MIAVVPFRLESSRFPRKVLHKVFGKSLIERALEKAALLKAEETVLTSSEEDYEEVMKVLNLDKYEYRFISSSPACGCATERVVEIAGKLGFGDIFISLPVDEAMLPAEELGSVIQKMDLPGDSIGTFYCDFFSLEDALSPYSAKVVTSNTGRVLYMSRAVIPSKKDGSTDLGMLKKNVGVFVFPQSAIELLESATGRKTILDSIEGLEQLRWLELGIPLYARKIRHTGFGIDVPEHISMIEERFG